MSDSISLGTREAVQKDTSAATAIPNVSEFIENVISDLLETDELQTYRLLPEIDDLSETAYARFIENTDVEDTVFEPLHSRLKAEGHYADGTLKCVIDALQLNPGEVKHLCCVRGPRRRDEQEAVCVAETCVAASLLGIERTRRGYTIPLSC